MQPASRIAALDFSQVPLGFLVDYFVFRQSVGWLELVSCALICVSGLLVFHIAYKEQNTLNARLSDASTGALDVPLLS